jgi:hypothetical protein
MTIRETPDGRFEVGQPEVADHADHRWVNLSAQISLVVLQGKDSAGVTFGARHRASGVAAIRALGVSYAVH